MSKCREHDEKLLKEWIEEKESVLNLVVKKNEVERVSEECSCYLVHLEELAHKYSINMDSLKLLFADMGKSLIQGLEQAVDRIFLTTVGKSNRLLIAVECFSTKEPELEEERIGRFKGKFRSYFSSIMLNHLSEKGLIGSDLVNIRKVLMIFIKPYGQLSVRELEKIVDELSKILGEEKDDIKYNTKIVILGLNDVRGKWRNAELFSSCTKQS